MLSNLQPDLFGGGAESAIVVPSAKEAMAKQILQKLGPAKGAGLMPPAPRAKSAAVAERFKITPSIRDWIRTKILAWSGSTVTWEGIRDVVKKKYPKGVWKRQSLARHPVLQDAFRATKKRLAQERAEQGKRGRATAGSDDLAQQRIQYLEGRVKDLETENDRLKGQFIRWQRNAFAVGISLAQLDKPLRPIDRGQVNE